MNPGRHPSDAAARQSFYLDEDQIVAQAPFVRAVLAWMGIPGQDREDLVQEVLASAWRKMTEGGFKVDPCVLTEDSLRSWLYGITWRQVSHYRGKAHRRREVLCADPTEHEHALPPVHVPAPDGPYVAREVLAALDRIPAKYREALILHRLEGFTSVEIGEILGVSDAAVRSRIQQGVRHLARAALLWRRPRS